jgi:hypothetical protein
MTQPSGRSTRPWEDSSRTWLKPKAGLETLGYCYQYRLAYRSSGLAAGAVRFIATLWQCTG